MQPNFQALESSGIVIYFSPLLFPSGFRCFYDFLATRGGEAGSPIAYGIHPSLRIPQAGRGPLREGERCCKKGLKTTSQMLKHAVFHSVLPAGRIGAASVYSLGAGKVGRGCICCRSSVSTVQHISRAVCVSLPHFSHLSRVQPGPAVPIR